MSADASQRSLFRRLLGQGGLYALSNLGVKAAGLLLLGFYLDPDLLTAAEYGYLVLLETTAQVLVIVAGLGIGSGLLKLATDPAYANRRDALLTTALAASSLCGVGAVMLVGAVARPLADFLLDDAEATLAVWLMGVYAGLKVVAAVPYVVLRVRERAGLFALAALTEIGLLLGGVVYFLAVRDAGLVGVMQGFVLAATGAVLLLGGGLLRTLRWEWDPRLVRPLLKLGVPLAFAAIASIALNAGDRYMLKAFADAEVVAVYGLAAKFGGVINMLFVQSFNLAFSVLGLKAIAAEGRRAPLPFHQRIARLYTVVTGWGVLGLALLTLDVTAWLSPNALYLQADLLVLPIALGFLVYGLYFVGMNVLYAHQATGTIAGAVAGAAALNLALNAVAIPTLGGLGAALTSFVAYAVLAAVTLVRAAQVGGLRVSWRSLVVVVFVVVGLWWIAQATVDWEPLERISARLGLLASYPLIVLVLGVYTREELQTLRARLSRR
ncbi:MAG: polysaccharide biosynthesis C-terminal domain-containing protein [Bacteroidota bacterium]